MPVTVSAQKKVRVDKKRHSRNLRIKMHLKETIKKARKRQKRKDISSLQSAIDKAAKKGVIHRNKAARLKSRLLWLLK